MFPGDLVQSSPRSFGPAEVALPRFSLTVRILDLGFREVRVEGELDLAVADQLKRAIDGAVGGPVLVDLSGCSFIDSTGIAVVLLARRDGERVAIHSPSEQVLRILSQVGLTGDGVVFGGREEAIFGLVGRDGDG
jgi:anti-anti-sigma factor